MTTTFKEAVVANIIGAILTVILFMIIENLRGKRFDAPGLR